MSLGYRRKQNEKGEAEVLFFATVLVIVGLISAALWIFGWVRETKDARVDANRVAAAARRTPAPFVPRLDPGEYYVSCKKSALTIVSGDASCDILEESYREREVHP